MALALSTINPVICTNLMQGYTSTVTTGGTTVLTSASSQAQFFTGTSAHTVTLPPASTLINGLNYIITNRSTGSITIQTSAAVVVMIVPPSSQTALVCTDTTEFSGTGGWFPLQTAASSSSAGGSSNVGSYNATTVGATTTDLCTLVTASGPAGTAYTVIANIALGSGVDGGMFNIYCRAKNLLGVVSTQLPMLNATSLDIGIAAAEISVVAIGQNIILRATGVAAKTIKWYSKVEVISQMF